VDITYGEGHRVAWFVQELALHLQLRVARAAAVVELSPAPHAGGVPVVPVDDPAGAVRCFFRSSGLRSSFSRWSRISASPEGMPFGLIVIRVSARN
jgi:hypothetical protein